MIDTTDTIKGSASERKFTSLNRGLVFWFLLLSLLPLSVVSLVGYQNAKISLTEAAVEKLEQSSSLSLRYLKNWFDYRFMDLQVQSESHVNRSFLKKLIAEYHQNGESLATYVKSTQWQNLIEKRQEDLLAFNRDYDYVYDLFLIDTNGNLLYSVQRETDLGTNLFDGVYANTLFSKGIKTSLKTGKAIFSDLERYEPSKKMLTGFFIAPLLDESGDNLGVVAIQVHIDQVFNIFQKNLKKQSSLIHYLVNEDGRLRSNLQDDQNEILNRVIDTEQYHLWKDEHLVQNPDEMDGEESIQEENAFEYGGPNGEIVIGIHKLLRLPGIQWALISEINKNDALAPAIWLGKLTLFLVLITAAIVILTAIFLARRISRPIIALADTSMRVAAGEIGHQVEINENNEIGRLAEAFNHMLQSRYIHEQDLQQSNEKAKRALEELDQQKFALDQHSIVAITDIKGTITFTNEKFSEISGYSQEELLGQNHRLLNSGFHDTAFFREMFQVIAKGKVWHGEVCNKAKNGKLYWVDTTIVPFLGSDGKPQSYVAIRTDITNRKNTEIKLAESSKQLELIIENTDVGIWDWMVDTGEVTFNARWAEIMGYALEELEPLNIDTWMTNIHPDDLAETEQLLKQYWSGETDHYFCEMRIKHKLGDWVWVSNSGKVVEWYSTGKPKRMIGTNLDITKSKFDESELIRAKDEAEVATQLKSDFLANMSHEIRTPMNGVIGMTGLLLETNLTSKQRDYAKNTMKSADALLTIINDILDFSKIEAGKLDLEQLPFDLQMLAEDVAELMALKCHEKNVEMLLRFKPGTQRFLIGDPGRIRQILLNLLSNAVKFTEEGSIVLTIESYVIIDNKATILVKVEDTGIGIENEKLDKIFSKFDQEDGSTSRKYGGTGLGLSICRQLCHMMEGDIVAQSQKGKGSLFSFTMALGINDTQTISPVEYGETTYLKGLKTLIVDDLEIAQTILNEQLSELDLRIELAESADKAIDMLKHAIKKEDPFDIVFTDYCMPETNGEMLAEEIKRQALLDNGALILVTSVPRKGDDYRLSNMGFDGYLTKPTHPSEVPQILSMVWDAKRQGEFLPLINRHSVHESGSEKKHKIKFLNTHILLVEDNPINRMVATEYLEGYGCSITPAGNGLEAVESVKERTFDLIFMDCQMPEMDGFEATAEIRKLEQKTNHNRMPIIAFTANAMQSDKDNCLAAGMDDFISKPVSPNALENVLIKWLPEKTGEVVQADEIKNSTEISVAEESEGSFDFEMFNQLKKLFKEKFPSTVESHISNAQNNVKLIVAAIQQGNRKELELAAHSLKGASAQFGAIELSELAKTIEQLAEVGDLEKAGDLVDKLHKAQQDIAHVMLHQIGEDS